MVEKKCSRSSKVFGKWLNVAKALLEEERRDLPLESNEGTSHSRTTITYTSDDTLTTLRLSWCDLITSPRHLSLKYRRWFAFIRLVLLFTFDPLEDNHHGCSGIYLLLPRVTGCRFCNALTWFYCLSGADKRGTSIRKEKGAYCLLFIFFYSRGLWKHSVLRLALSYIREIISKIPLNVNFNLAFDSGR